MARQMPGPIVNSLRLLWLMVVVSGVITALIWWMRDDVLEAWAEGNPSARAILEDPAQGIEVLRDSPIAPSFTALAVVAFITLALFALVMAAFLAGGHAWARLMLTFNAFTGVVISVTCLANDLPMVFVVLSILLLVLGVVQLFFLWHKESTRYLREV